MQTVHDLNPTRRRAGLTEDADPAEPCGADYTMDEDLDEDLDEQCRRLHCKPPKRLHNVAEDTCTSFLDIP